MLVRVYKNRHRSCFSVMDAKTRKVIAHRDVVRLYGVRFVVSEKGRQRTIREGHRNVHAFAQGEWDDVGAIQDLPPRLVRYNPYVRGAFFDQSDATVRSADMAVLTGGRIYID